MISTPLEFLKATINAKRLSHAYLFSGNNKEEQLKTALLVSELLKTNSADVIVLDFKAIEQVRVLSERLSLGAWASEYKIAILKDVEQATQEAQSALLKILEEPRGDTIFFLLTTFPFLLLPTIRSRTQEVRFWKFPQSEGESFSVPTSLTARFEYAKELAESENLQEILQDWFLRLRHTFITKFLKEDMAKVLAFSKTLRLFEETLYLLQTTNVNPRLAVERLLLAL